MAGLDGFDTGNMEGGIGCWKHTAAGLITLDIRKGPTNLGANLQGWKSMHGVPDLLAYPVLRTLGVKTVDVLQVSDVCTENHLSFSPGMVTTMNQSVG